MFKKPPYVEIVFFFLRTKSKSLHKTYTALIGHDFLKANSLQKENPVCAIVSLLAMI